MEQKVCPIGIDWKEQLKSIFSVLGLLVKIPPNRPSEPVALLRRKFGAAKGGGELRRGGSAAPEH